MPDNPIATPAPPPTAEGLLQQLVAQQEQANLLRLKELAQQAEFTRATMAKAQAEAEAARQLAESNEINRRQIEVVEKLLADVEEWVRYFKSGKAEKASGMVRDKLDNLTHVVEAMILNRPHDETTSVLLGIIRGESAAPRGTGQLRTRSNSAQYLEDENELVNALLECAPIQNNFEAIKGDLPIEVGSRISGGDNKVAQVKAMVRACAQYGAIRQMVDAVGFYEQGSIAFGEVLEIMRKSGG